MARCLTLAALLVSGATGVAAQQGTPPPPGEPQPFEVPEGREFTLPNGLEVTLVEYGRVPKATVQLTVRVGNADEAADEVWLADMTGDLLEEGTTTLSAEELATRAASIGGSIRVGVGESTTSIGGSALSEYAPEMIRLVADLARNPRFPADDLTRIKADRLRSLSIGRSQPQQLALEEFREVLYPDQPYGRLFPSEEMIQAYTAEQIRAFYDRHFNAGRARLYVVGRFDPAAVEAAARDAFAGWAGGAEVAPPIPEPAEGRAIYLVDKPGSVQTTIYLGLPVIDPSHPDYIPLQVTNALLGGSFASRITSNIREDKGYTYSPYSSVSARYRGAYWVQTADVTTDVTGASLREIFKEIDRLRREPPPADELRGIQNYLAGTFVLQNSSRGGIINQLSFVELHGLDEDWLDTYVQRVYAVTPEEVSRVVRTYLEPARMPIVLVGDREKIEQQVTEFGDIQPGDGAVAVTPDLSSRAALQAWEMADPTGWTIEDGALVLHTRGQPSGPIRKPAQYAVLKEGPFADVTVSAEARADAPVERMGRDLLVFFGFQSPTRFYYVHLSNETRGPHNGIFLVNDADRVRLDDMTAVPRLTDQEWRTVRVERDVDTGEIAVYYAGLPEPVLTAVDRTLTWGRVGFGSFDDPAAFRRIRVVGQVVDPETAY